MNDPELATVVDSYLSARITLLLRKRQQRGTETARTGVTLAAVALYLRWELEPDTIWHDSQGGKDYLDAKELMAELDQRAAEAMEVMAEEAVRGIKTPGGYDDD